LKACEQQVLAQLAQLTQLTWQLAQLARQLAQLARQLAQQLAQLAHLVQLLGVQLCTLLWTPYGLLMMMKTSYDLQYG
jgi:ABC-type transporter Mla subunit MlaD